MATPKITLTLTVEDASHVEDALTYWLMAAKDNYGAGYDRTEEAREEQRRYKRVDAVASRLGIRVMAAQEESDHV